MLEQLIIENFAIIERSDISFRPGLNILSGETGAGKSILIDSISLICGARAESGQIRNGSDRAEIRAIFQDLSPNMIKYLQDNELSDLDNPENLIIRRILREKNTKNYLNSIAVSAAQIRDFVPEIINIHGQNAGQKLLHSDGQRERLDNFADNQNLLENLADIYKLKQKIILEIKNLEEKQKYNQQQLELLNYQIEEFEQINPQDGEFAKISAKHKLLASASEIMSTAGNISHFLHSEDSPINSLRYCLQQTINLLSISDNFQESQQLLDQSLIYAQEARDSLDKSLSKIETNPEEFYLLDKRLADLHRLATKHKIPPEDLTSKYQQLIEERNSIDKDSDSLENLNAELVKVQKKYYDLANQIHHNRVNAANKLSSSVEKLIHQLGMQKAVFKIEINPSKESIYGMDEIIFMLSANPGQNPQAVSKIASGGELSRISLAIETATNTNNQKTSKTLIFDEIDAGIGGETAHTVGKLLANLALNQQILCITHLAQVASYADMHLRIEKIINKTLTLTKVRELNWQERKIEIARMIGSADSKTSQSHAEELLNRAKEEKERIISQKSN